MRIIQLGAIERLERDARRVTEVVRVLAKYGLADWLGAIPMARLQDWLRSVEGEAITGLTGEVRVRLALSELGTTFIKLGQMLSTRPDLIGPELAKELSRLQSDTPADPDAIVRTLIEEELGRPLDDLFAAFEARAFASASIAQAHRARLLSGEAVVVKVQMAGIVPKVEADLSILSGLAELAEKHVEALRIYEPVALVEQLRRTILRELDFNRERRNIEEFARNFADHPRVHFPRVWPEFSGRRVLTMEQLDGIPGSEVGRLQSSGIDLSEFARTGATMYLQMIFRDSFYHADPHPGNLMLLPGGVVGVMDCGMVGRLDEALRDELEGLLLAVAHVDTDALTDAVWNLCTVPPLSPREHVRADLADFIGEYVGQSIKNLNLSAALDSLAEIMHRHHIILPSGASLLVRTLVVLEGTAQLLSPEFSLAELIQPLYQRSIGSRFSPQRLALRLQRTYRDWDRLLQVFPRDLSDTLQRIRSGRFVTRLEHRHLDPVVNRLVLGILTASLFLGSSLLWSMKAPPLLGGVSVFGAAGYLASIYLGWRVLHAIKKSGKLDSDDQ